MNKIDLIGRLTATPDFRLSEDNKPYVKFRLAVRNFTKEADFFNCTAFGRVAEIITEHCDKGLRLGVSGRMVNSNWEDEEGITHYNFEVIVNDAFLIDSVKPVDSNESAFEKAPKTASKAAPKTNSKYNRK